MKLAEILKKFVCAEDTCDEVIECFEKGNEPKGPYFSLAKYFCDENYIGHSETDEAYKNWLKELIDTERESKSIILNILKTKYQEKESLKCFVFSLNNMSPELNQKWHFFISYWGLREYITKYPEKNTDNLTPLKSEDEAINGNLFKYCPEGKIWYNCMPSKCR